MGKRAITYFAFFLWLLFGTIVFSQQREFITGRLLDATTNEPIVFASIRIKDQALGVISNVDGSFKIPIKYKAYGDILEISSMGYQSKEFLIQEMSENTLHILKLEPAVFGLSETIVTAKKKKTKLSARQIVRKAIAAIPQNYPTDPFSTIGYYRDYQFNENKYVNLNEAILEVFDYGFDEPDYKTTQVKIFDYIENKDFEADNGARQQYNYQTSQKVIDNAYLSGYGGNEFVILRVHDAIRNSKVNSYDFANILVIDFMKNHTFSKEPITFLNDEALYVIRFNALKPGYRVHGTMYISKRDFSIHKMEYALYNNRKLNKSQKPDKNGFDKQLIFEVTTAYARRDNKMYLNFISFNNSFKLWQPPIFQEKYIDIDVEKGRFIVEFSQKVDKEDGKILSNYTFKFKDKKIDFEKVEVGDEKVFLYPKRKYATQAEEVRTMFFQIDSVWKKNSTETEKIGELLVTDIKNIHDVKGNLLGEWTTNNYNQFREFFVQEVKTNTEAPLNSRFMDKKRPIFKDQPIARQDNFDKYWMNTPLPPIKD
ncbi:carboxypeptidase-like regulatory domain-containing protein [Maribacter halichondriae]|uniref:carboxypeptidase-like regulatory domain-containing protein n=1 Tax=Maribacter halichondriae TaxID=2980554 RepID=UPI002358BF06|nr:carboxypeptidase-like regulatory domain-containing protein [Maribacter sp. Hal144]